MLDHSDGREDNIINQTCGEWVNLNNLENAVALMLGMDEGYKADRWTYRMELANRRADICTQIGFP